MKDEDKIQIRVATAIDATTISNILREAFEEFKPLYTPLAFDATAITTAEVLTRIKDGVVWVALLHNSIIGTIGAVPQKDKLYIRGMGVSPSARGLGVGNKLMQKVQAYAIANNFKSLLLSTTPYLHAAIHLYEEFGFKRISETDNSFFGTAIFKMEKVLSR